MRGPEPRAAARSRRFRARVARRSRRSRVRIDKRIPVAAGLGGGSADAAAVLRAANRIAGEPLDAAELRELAAGLGSDVPSQVEPRHALVQGTGELVEPIELPPLAAVLVPHARGAVHRRRSTPSSTARAAGASGSTRSRCAPRRAAGRRAGRARSRTTSSPPRSRCAPSSADASTRLARPGALGAAVSGSGPTCFGLFDDRGRGRGGGRLAPGRARGERGCG